MTFFQLVQWRAAIKCERVGMRHSSGRSVRKHAALELGLPHNASHDDVLAVLQKRINELKN